jgi:hypothetical protein
MIKLFDDVDIDRHIRALSLHRSSPAPKRQIPDPPHLPRLRCLSGERQRSCGAAEERDELAPPHSFPSCWDLIGHSAAASGGVSNRSPKAISIPSFMRRVAGLSAMTRYRLDPVFDSTPDGAVKGIIRYDIYGRCPIS